MWKSVVGHDVSVSVETQGDDWDTDPDFVNDISEKEQRWGAKTIEGSGRTEHINIHQLRSKVSEEHDVLKKKEMESGPKASHGYGGRFGVEKDRMDKSAVGHEYVAEVEKHSSQTDAAKGFGGKYGVERDRADKSAVGFDYKGEVEKHTSQKDYSHGFGGRYGVEKDKRDKAALGYDYKGETEKHESQTDYAKGFGGQYGIQKDRVDKSAVGFSEMEAPTTAYKKTTPIEAASSGARGLKAKFESMAEEKRKREEEEKAQQMSRQQQERKAVKISREAQQLEKPVEEPVASAPLPKKISSEVWPPAESHPLPEPEPVRTSRKCPVPPLPTRQNPPEDTEEPPELPPRTPEVFQLEEEPVYEAAPEPENDYEDVEEVQRQEPDDELEGDYEDVLEPENSSFPSAQAGSSGSPAGARDSGTSAVALYDYQGEGSDELSFDPDDIITDIEMVDEGWWRGRCGGHFGLFPANYVKLL
ncbi:hematopoietic lineage cell-specific protein isoform X1 [Perognathus longimembris pacificus]|uniref:hematopoietic lineage cell-specific protein isoform X1 n=1 Tax=Perognathus longimembris pacificus TaxID=214514 RepID=UPI0020198081|nr:hematopoietic lineage cell-specific protein isoform X1 [Perognathus longimembris pacificus]